MAVVDVDSVAAQHKSDLVDEGQSDCLDTKHLQDLLNVVGVGALEVDLVIAEHLSESDTVSFNEPVLRRVSRLQLLSSQWTVLSLVILSERDLGDLGNTAERNLIKNLVHDLFEVHGSRFLVIVIIVLNVLDSDSHDELVVIVVGVHLVNLVLEGLVDLVGNLGHGQVARVDSLGVELEAHQPRREFITRVGVIIEDYIVVRDEDLLVVLDDGVLRIGVVEDLSRIHYLRQGCVLNLS